MSNQALILENGEVLGRDALEQGTLLVADGQIADIFCGNAGGNGGIANAHGRKVDLSGWTVAPGIVDVHGDGFERHVAVRRGALTAMEHGLFSVEAELAANGITTAVLAQFYSWEGGMRGPEFADRLFSAWEQAAPQVKTDLRLQLRLETHMFEQFDDVFRLIDRTGLRYAVFNDHLPHERLAAGKTPPRLTGQALKAGRSPEKHLENMKRLHGLNDRVFGELKAFSAELTKRGVQIGSHDDDTAEKRAKFRSLGANVSEFPETIEAAQAAREAGDLVVMGSPNIVRGASHAGKVSAREIVAMGLCDALASDYHYPSPRYAALELVKKGICDLPAAWRLVSEGPAKVLGLTDRGVIEAGKRADLVIFDRETGRVGATMAGGKITYMTSPLAERFI